MAAALLKTAPAHEMHAKARGAKAKTREAWLMAFVTAAQAKFTEVGAPIPANIRASIGFSSKGARSNRIGECWSSCSSNDGVFEMFVVPTITSTRQIAGVLTHEIVHAAVGLEAGHGPKFRKIATAVGLVGKMTATTEGPLWDAWAEPILKKIGAYPAASLKPLGKSTAKPKQTTRMLKAECPACDFAFRTTRLHFEAVNYEPACPACATTMEVLN
jgi:hypothetical protein